MSTKTYDDVFLLAGGERVGGNCQWHESVCTDPAVGYLVYPDDSEVFCLRHYTLSLAQLVEAHVPFCPLSLSEHLIRFGRF